MSKSALSKSVREATGCTVTRQGRNPKTGETIEIAASTSIKFSTAAALKKAL